MRYVTFAPRDRPQEPRLGAAMDDLLIDLHAAQTWAQGARGLPAEPLPNTLFELIHAGPVAWAYPRNLLAALEGVDKRKAKGARRQPVAYVRSEIFLFPPLPRPMSLRDFYAFEQHVATARAARGKEVPPEWYEIPVFYYSNANAVFGPDEAIPHPASTQALDYELEVACVIGRPGRDIRPEEAESYIFGYMIFNDWSARDVQQREMRVGLGPAKGKDFASSLGPWLVTPDELAERSTGRPGVFDLEMVARVNGRERSRGNWKDLYYSFGDMIARASEDTFLLPGDVLGSGTVGTGSLLELTSGEGPWLQPGDVVELEVERLGVLRNGIAEPVRRPEKKEVET